MQKAVLKERGISFTSLFRKCSPWPLVSQAEAKSQGFISVSQLHSWPIGLGQIPLLYPGTLSGSWIVRKTARIWAGVHMGIWHYRWWLIPLCDDAFLLVALCTYFNQWWNIYYSWKIKFLNGRNKIYKYEKLYLLTTWKNGSLKCKW